MFFPENEHQRFANYKNQESLDWVKRQIPMYYLQMNINEKYALLFLILYLMSAKYPNYIFVFSGQNSITYF